MLFPAVIQTGDPLAQLGSDSAAMKDVQTKVPLSGSRGVMLLAAASSSSLPWRLE